MALVGKFQHLRRAANRDAVFYAVMAVVSAISLLKIALLAIVLPKADFALYASVFAMVAFASEIISFGLTQATVKKYPRLVAFARAQEIEPDLRELWKTLGRRYAAIFVVASALGAYGWGLEGWLAATGVLLIAIGTNVFSVIASICRAFDHLISLAVFGLVRTLAATAVALGLALVSDWQTVLLGEGLVVASVGAAILVYLRREILRRAAEPVAGADAGHRDRLVSGTYDGVLTFAAFLLLMLPGSFDRMFVSAFDTLETKTLYAFVGIWTTAAVTVVGIYTQKFGPDIVRQIATQQGARPLAHVRKHAGILMLLMAAGTLASFLVVRVAFFDRLWVKYGVTWEAALMTALVTASFVSVLYDWTLLALDGEKQLLGGSVLLVGLVALFFCITALMHLGFFGYMASMCLARAAQIVWQDRAVAKLQVSVASTP